MDPELPGLPVRQSRAFQEILRTHRLCALNTWAGQGIKASTYIPPNANSQHGSQIDFVLLRIGEADARAKMSHPSHTEFVPQTGCRHLPVYAVLPMPARPGTSSHASRISPKIVQTALNKPHFADLPGNPEGPVPGSAHSSYSE